MTSDVERRRERLIWVQTWDLVGRFCRFGGLTGTVLLALLFLFPAVSRAGNISLTLSGSLNFTDASPDFAPILGPESIALEVKAVGRSGIPWTLTLIADSDFQSGPDFIPVSVVSWTAFPNPPYMDGTLSAVTPALIASGLTHEHATITFDFEMQNSWTYNVGTYSATATFTLAAP